MAKTLLFATAAVCLMLSGCSEKKVALSKAAPLFGESSDQCLDDPKFVLAISAPGDMIENLVSVDCKEILLILRQFGFSNQWSGGKAVANKEELAIKRNEVMDALVAVSNRKCGDYSAYLKTHDGQVNSLLSVLAIITGAAGGVAAVESTAKALSTSSAIFSGSRAAVNDAWFSNQTIQVLSAAFEKARHDQIREIRNRQSCPIEHYSLMAGFSDALQYHSSCSLTTGLATAAQAIERSDQPGVDVMRRQLADLKSIRTEANQLANGAPNGRSILVENQFNKLSFARQELARANDQLRQAKNAKSSAESKAEKAAIANDPSIGDAALKAAIASDRDVVSANQDISDANGAVDAAKVAETEAEKELESLHNKQVSDDRARSTLDDFFIARTYSEVPFCPFTTMRPGMASPPPAEPAVKTP